MADKLIVTAEPHRAFSIRGETPLVADASPDVNAKVEASLKAALQTQLATELHTLGNVGEKLTIHGRTGVSNVEGLLERPVARANRG